MAGNTENPLSSERTAALPSERAMTQEKGSSRPAVGKSVFAGSLVMLAFFGGLGSWATLAPLESAAIAQGSISVDSNRKTIQHLEGGIVGKILVRDGDVVKAGQVLIRLDETQARATLELLRGRQIATLALVARLTAERGGKAKIIFPDELVTNRSEPNVAEAIDGETNIFRVRRKTTADRVSIQEHRIAQLEEEIKGLKGQIRAEATQIRLIKDEIKDVKSLVDKGFGRRPRLLALQRRQAEIEGSRSRNRAAIARTKQSISETRIRITELQTEMLNDVLLQLRQAQSELFDLADRIQAAEDVLRRLEIRAQLPGTIVGLQVHTPGGVIGAGERLMDIVPSGDQLVIEAQVDPNDIDVVHVGLKAQVRLSAFNMRETVPVEGVVTAVSADRLSDQRTGQSYYLARIRLTGDLKKVLGDAELQPGMPAEVIIVTGARTTLEYIFKPISASLNRAFREQ